MTPLFRNKSTHKKFEGRTNALDEGLFYYGTISKLLQLVSELEKLKINTEKNILEILNLLCKSTQPSLACTHRALTNCITT